MLPDETQTRFIRVFNEDSVFVYWIFEALEGWVSYSTLSFEVSDYWRDLELTIPVGFLTDFDRVLKQLSDSGLQFQISDLRSTLKPLVPHEESQRVSGT